MRSSNILLIAIAVLVLGLSSAHLASSNLEPAPVSKVESPEVVDSPTGAARALKTTKSDDHDDGQEEERLNLSFLKKVPGVSQLRASMAARKAAAQAKRAEFEQLFKITDPREFIVFDKFPVWKSGGLSGNQAHAFMKEAGTTDDIALKVERLYKIYRMNDKSR